MSEKIEASSERDGGQAFPHGNQEQGGSSGMTLRDWFAGQALAGMLANQERLLNIVCAEDTQVEADAAVARQAYAAADSMLVERSK